MISPHHLSPGPVSLNPLKHTETTWNYQLARARNSIPLRTRGAPRLSMSSVECFPTMGTPKLTTVGVIQPSVPPPVTARCPPCSHWRRTPPTSHKCAAQLGCALHTPCCHDHRSADHGAMRWGRGGLLRRADVPRGLCDVHRCLVFVAGQSTSLLQGL